MKIDPPAQLRDLPIPEDARPTKLWGEQMLELAAHIGPYATLLLVDRLGGQKIYIPAKAERNRIAAVVGEDHAATLSRVYAGNEILVPTAKPALSEARRGPILAAIREGTLTIAQAVPILQMTSRYISRLLNSTDEGLCDRAWVPARIRPKNIDTRQMDMFPDFSG